ncbi:Hypothetical predicted protein [Lecanosticta acicola]|uniref:Uncharacterized protein n=1 Tax=Lecanosticta acicola TaxID=111012 RepID=A0AAI9EB97_9PEZI|nr:Hypothetical predicted protein [Lecanosticta acicola]
MAVASEAITNILHQLMDEYGSRLSIDGGSDVLVSDPSLAKSLHEATEPVRTPFGPKITITARSTPEAPRDLPNTSVVAADALQMDHYTHAVFGIDAEDPKYILEGLKKMLYGMRPKGYAIVISLKHETKRGENGEGGTVSLEDKMKYQSKGKIDNLSDVLYYAGFERGRIRSLDKVAKLSDGREQGAEVILAMKWDQLTA